MFPSQDLARIVRLDQAANYIEETRVTSITSGRRRQCVAPLPLESP